MSESRAEPLDEEQVRRFSEICKDGVASGRLTARDLEFLDSMASRLQRYGVRTTVSPKQSAWFDRIEQRLYAV